MMAGEQEQYHGVRIVLRREWLHEILALPDDVHIRAVYEDAVAGEVCLHVEGERLPEVADGAYPPLARLVRQSTPDGHPRFVLELPESGSEVTC